MFPYNQLVPPNDKLVVPALCSAWGFFFRSIYMTYNISANDELKPQTIVSQRFRKSGTTSSLFFWQPFLGSFLEAIERDREIVIWGQKKGQRVCHVSHIWLRTDAGFEEFQLIESMHTGKTLAQVSEMKQSQEALVRNKTEAALQAKIQLMAFIENAAAQSTPSEKTSIKGFREKRQTERRRKHKNIEEVIRNE